MCAELFLPIIIFTIQRTFSKSSRIRIVEYISINVANNNKSAEHPWTRALCRYKLFGHAFLTATTSSSPPPYPFQLLCHTRCDALRRKPFAIPSNRQSPFRDGRRWNEEGRLCVWVCLTVPFLRIIIALCANGRTNFRLAIRIAIESQTTILKEMMMILNFAHILRLLLFLHLLSSGTRCPRACNLLQRQPPWNAGQTNKSWRAHLEQTILKFQDDCPNLHPSSFSIGKRSVEEFRRMCFN